MVEGHVVTLATSLTRPEFLPCAWEKSTFLVFSKFPSPSRTGSSADGTLPHHRDHQLLQEKVQKYSACTQSLSRA